MPIEIISLLSSPERPPPKPRSHEQTGLADEFVERIWSSDGFIEPFLQPATMHNESQGNKPSEWGPQTKSRLSGVCQKLASTAHHSSHGRRNVIIDAIDVSSSPGRAFVANVPQKRKFDLEDDPFASSPLPRPAIVTAPKATKDASCGGVLKNLPKNSVSGRHIEWDYISSSAPTVGIDGDPLASSPKDPPAARPGRTRGLPGRRSASVSFLDSSDYELPDLAEVQRAKLTGIQNSTQKTTSTRTSRPTTNKAATNDEKSRERAERAAAKAAELERKKEEKERAKEQRALEKQRAAALAEVNKLRTDKRTSALEMIVDLPSSLDPGVRLLTETLLSDLGAEHHSWNPSVDNLVRWRRKVRAAYRDDLGHWEPVPLHIETDEHALVILPAAEFVKLALGPKEQDLEAHVLKTKAHFPENQVVYLIEGLTAWMRKNKNARNRQFTSAVRGGLADTGGNDHSTAPPSGGNNNTNNGRQAHGRRNRVTQPRPTYVDDEAVDDALLALQVAHGMLVHHTATPAETAQWIGIFTQHVGTAPYRQQRERADDAAGVAFCMDAGQVRAGDSGADTYVRMLQEIVRVTAPIAYGVAAEFPSVSKLVRGLEAGGPLRLEDVPKSMNSEGAASDRRVGQAVSRRLYKIFTARDETSTDV